MPSYPIHSSTHLIIGNGAVRDPILINQKGWGKLLLVLEGGSFHGRDPRVESGYTQLGIETRRANVPISAKHVRV